MNFFYVQLLAELNSNIVQFSLEKVESGWSKKMVKKKKKEVDDLFDKKPVKHNLKDRENEIEVLESVYGVIFNFFLIFFFQNRRIVP